LFEIVAIIWNFSSSKELKGGEKPLLRCNRRSPGG
jgi:hypothetical protein